MDCTIIDGIKYPITPESFERLKNRGSIFAYESNNPDNFYDKRNIRVYNHNTKYHYYLENVEVKIGDSNLLFIDFPRSDGPMGSWDSSVTQHAIVKSWGQSRGVHAGCFVRFRIDAIDKDGYCRVYDGYNENHSGLYARNCFYEINKII
jgi:hypothetical protein